MAGNEGDSVGSRSEGFETIMARFFNPEGGAEEEGGSLAGALEELRQRPADPELHGDLARRLAGLREAVPAGLDDAGLGVVEALETMFRQMASFDIRLHRVMYQDLEAAVQALEAVQQGKAPDHAFAELEGRLRRHLFEEATGDAAEAGGEDSAEEAAADGDDLLADIDRLFGRA